MDLKCEDWCQGWIEEDEYDYCGGDVNLDINLNITINIGNTFNNCTINNTYLVNPILRVA